MANHFEMWRFTYGPEIFDGPLVSVLIPARNEEKNIERCVKSLTDQLYKNYEIVILNDNSIDATETILKRLAMQDSRIRIINGKPLPDDWYGKPFALHQLTAEARGEILLFTDADTCHMPGSISWAVTNLLNLKADMISGYIGQIFKKIGEVITVSLMFFLTGFVIPLFLNRYVKSSMFSAAVGQFIVIKRDVFNAIGGCEAFKKKTSEDIYMARYAKKRGYKTAFLNLSEYVKCRMYEGYRDAFQGVGKNVFDFFGKNTIAMFLAAIAVFFFLFFPFPLLFINIATASPWTLHTIMVCVLFTLTWLFMFLNLRLNAWYCLFWPLMFLNLLYLAGWSWFRTVSGKGFIWKDRKVN
jgi:chlorobactene glucosyltransferase